MVHTPHEHEAICFAACPIGRRRALMDGDDVSSSSSSFSSSSSKYAHRSLYSRITYTLQYPSPSVPNKLCVCGAQTHTHTNTHIHTRRFSRFDAVAVVRGVRQTTESQTYKSNHIRNAHGHLIKMFVCVWMCVSQRCVSANDGYA